MRLPAGAIPAVFFDGESARRHEVTVEPALDGLTLIIRRADRAAPDLAWPLADLRALADQAGGGTLTLTFHTDTGDEAPRDPARLVITDPDAIRWFRTTRPGLFRRDLRRGTLKRVALWLGAAAAAVVLMLFVILPGLADILATRLPPETEVRFGRLALAQIEDFLSGWEGGEEEDSETSLTCTDPAGLAALERLEARLTKGQDIGYDIELNVFNHDMVNAFALPGGHVVILRGLLDEASGPDEVAGVLAHEIGHVAHRDPTRLMLRAAGSAGILSVVLGDISGGALVAVAGEQLMRAAYTREAEAAADAFAFDLLASAGISAEALAGFFDRIAEETDLMPEYLSSHPASAGRAGRARDSASAAAAQGKTFTPALSAADWAALKAICGRS